MPESRKHKDKLLREVSSLHRRMININSRSRGFFHSMIESLDQDAGGITPREVLEKNHWRGVPGLSASQLLDLVLNSTKLHVALLDRDFNFIRVNDTYARANGHQPDYFPGKNHFTLFPHKENEQIFRRVMETREPYNSLAKPFIFPDHPERGVTFWDWSLTPLEDNDGRVDGLIFTLLDVTGRVRAEEQVKSERQRLFSVLGLLPASVTLIQSDYTIPFANYQARAAFGDPAEKKCHQLFHGQDKPCPDCAMSKIISGRQMRKAEQVRSNGRCYEVHQLPFNDEDREMMILEMAIDITERKGAEEARQLAEQKLESQRTRAIMSDRLRSLGEMAAGMSHELNQPLFGIRGTAEHVLLSLDRGWDMPTEKLRDKMTLILEQSDRMKHVIEEARRFARKSDQDSVATVKVNDVISMSIRLIGAQIRSKGIELRLNLAPELPLVKVNPYSLEEVIINLVNNARDAIIEKIKRDGGGDFMFIELNTGATADGKGVIIEVVDRGPGISSKDMIHVFEPFFTTKDPETGTGLGLPICRGIVSRFGGTMEIDSREGEGTRVVIRLPAIEN